MQQQQLPLLLHVNPARLHQSAAKATSAAAICPATSVMQQAAILSTAAGVQSLLLPAQSVQPQGASCLLSTLRQTCPEQHSCHRPPAANKNRKAAAIAEVRRMHSFVMRGEYTAMHCE